MGSMLVTFNNWLAGKMPCLVRALRSLLAGRCFRYDRRRLVGHSCAFRADSREKQATLIAMDYHVAEKGLTMPNRRMGFGQPRILKLMNRIRKFERAYGLDDFHVAHAVGVVRSYAELHEGWDGRKDNPAFWETLDAFVAGHPGIPPARQLHFTQAEFFGALGQPFPVFAASRHSVRHYAAKELPMPRIRAAVQLATTAPCACNRQYIRVHCVSDKARIKSLLDLQGGSRGFGHLADKLLVVTADLEGIIGERERNDLYTNGGIFLMNLCYGLHCQKIAHCVLNWSKFPKDDLAMRRLLDLKASENVVAFLTCGEAPEEFDVAASPRKPLSDILVEH